MCVRVCVCVCVCVRVRVCACVCVCVGSTCPSSRLTHLTPAREQWAGLHPHSEVPQPPHRAQGSGQVSVSRHVTCPVPVGGSGAGNPRSVAPPLARSHQWPQCSGHLTLPDLDQPRPKPEPCRGHYPRRAGRGGGEDHRPPKQPVWGRMKLRGECLYWATENPSYLPTFCPHLSPSQTVTILRMSEKKVWTLHFQKRKGRSALT